MNLEEAKETLENTPNMYTREFLKGFIAGYEQGSMELRDALKKLQVLMSNWPSDVFPNKKMRCVDNCLKLMEEADQA